MRVIINIVSIIILFFAMALGKAFGSSEYGWIIIPIAVCWGIGWFIWRIKTPESEAEKAQNKKKFEEIQNRSTPII